MPERPLYPPKRTFKLRNPDSDLWMSALPPIADINGYVAGCPLMTQLGHSRGFESNGCLRPETVIHWDHAQAPLPDQKADNRANCCGALRSLRRLRRPCDLEAEAVGRWEFRLQLTPFGNAIYASDCVFEYFRHPRLKLPDEGTACRPLLPPDIRVLPGTRRIHILDHSEFLF